MSRAKIRATGDFASAQIARQGVHGFLIALIRHMSPIEAQLVVMGAASDRPSVVPQTVLHDVIERYKQEQSDLHERGAS